MHKSSSQQYVRRLASLPTAQGGLTRLAAGRARKAGLRLEPLLSGVGLTVDQINDPEHRITVRDQVAFLEAAAKALNDDFLGLNLAEEFDLRDLGLLYYVMASSDTLGDALRRASRYSRITNEAIVLEYREAGEPTLRLIYSGIPRHTDQQQIEFCVVAMVRISCALSGRQFLPKRVSMSHVRSKGFSKFARFLGKEIEFGSDIDEIGFPTGSTDWALAGADPRLNKILLKTCEESLSRRKSKLGTLRSTVENAIAPLLPHGQAHLDVIAGKLGMSKRTLLRRLSEEGTTFIDILQKLRTSLAIRYLKEDGMSISRVAWLLGFEETSSFSHAFRRWTGESPREFRQTH